MKKTTLFRLGALAVVVCIAMALLLSGTLARYTSEATGTDTATVAKWAFDVEGTDIALTNVFDFDLFAGTAKIAPGMSGSFEINLQNTSDVAAKYAIEFTETNTGKVPIKYSTDGSTWKDTPVELNVSDAQIAINGIGNLTVHWRWLTTSDEADTAFGVKGTLDTVTVAATVTATQDTTNIPAPQP